MDPEADLLRQIELAFSGMERPPRDVIVDAIGDEADEIAAYFAAAPHFGHAPETLRYHTSALSYFSLPAFVYWLPAFMMAVVADSQAADALVVEVPAHLCRDEWLSGEFFTEAQRAAILAFLRHGAQRFVAERDLYRAAIRVVEAWR